MSRNIRIRTFLDEDSHGKHAAVSFGEGTTYRLRSPRRFEMVAWLFHCHLRCPTHVLKKKI
jgi:hypothetical protein